MIDEDLRTARRRARRWGELNERRAAIGDRVRDARWAIDAVGVWDQEAVAAEEARLGAFALALTAVEQELAEVGPAQELYEELLAREERRLTESADPRGAKLLEIGRLLAEVNVELPARERAHAAGLAVLREHGDREALNEFFHQVRALGLMVDPPAPDGARGTAGPESGDVDPHEAGADAHAAGDVSRGAGADSGAAGAGSREVGADSRAAGAGSRTDEIQDDEAVPGQTDAGDGLSADSNQRPTLLSGPDDIQRLVERLEQHCQELERLHDRLWARREEILLG
ncbi:hypothetical protein [Nonomuraea zeae]|uniref:Uncharacterized protein n=1 Tax=Nonomuraea zeae TaxID=1642303 RepID=A0A5S4FQR5_9ACTN|nr:hypothetical protein [Nonomuraea zeae]TMR11666.1 hypothetical protein ETD85_59110 [Nonomuraea zeae]